MRFFKTLVFIFPLLFACVVASGQQVTTVKVVGNTNTDSYLIVSASGIVGGAELKPGVTRDAIKKVYRLGLFSDVMIDTTLVPAGVEVTIRVEEFTVVSAVKYTGNRKISDKKLEEEAKVVEGEIASPQRILLWKRRILDVYQEKGYLLAEVTDRQTPLEEGRMKLEFLIDEGKSVRIKQITILGNEHFPDGKVRRNMENKEKALFRSGSFKEDEFEMDLERIVEFYRKHGYADSKVTDHEIRYDDSKEWIYITITVDEGKRYKVGEISFEGNQVYQTGLLRKALKYKSGDVYDSEKMEKSLMEMYSIFGEDGYIYASIIPDESVRSDTIIDVEYGIAENNPARVRKIDIEGNMKTREKVIRRELKVLPGDIFRRSSLVRSQRAVYNLGFFEDVLIDSRRANEEGDIDLIFKVTEKMAGQIGLGVAYSQLDELTGYLTLSIPNLMGRGESSYIKLERGGRKTNVQVGYTEPWLFDTPLTVGTDLFYVTRVRDGYDEKRVGGALTASRPIPWLDYTRVYWMYRLEDVGYYPGYDTLYDTFYDTLSSEDLSEAVPNKSYSVPQVIDTLVIPRVVPRVPLEWEGERRASTTRLTLVRDTRDSYFNATMGTRNMISAEFVGGYLGGEVRYQKYEGESRWYHPVLWKHVIMFRARGGYVGSYQEGEAVPISERFFVGGVGDWGVRGYGDWGRDIGPRSGWNPLGGKVALVLNAEYKIPFAKSVYGLFFADAGNVWEGLRETELNSRDDMKKSAGFGIRIEIPMMGVMGFDFGYGFDKPDPGWQPHFQIGTAF